MTAYLYAAPLGVPGTVSRPDQSIVECAISGGSDLIFGRGGRVVMLGPVSALIPLADGSDITDFYGILARSAPELSLPTDGDLPAEGQMSSVFRSGYISVNVVNGTPVRGGLAYIYVRDTVDYVAGDFAATYDVDVVAAADSGNTGNGTIGTTSATQSSIEGQYLITMTSATAFDVTDPNSAAVGSGTAGVQFTAGGISLKITVGGTPMVATDFFTFDVTQNTQIIPRASWGMDGKDADNNGELFIRR